MISYTTESPWVSTSLPTYAALATDLHVDICVVGGGLCGITTAYLLQKEGVRVALLERDTLACGDTARSGGLCREHVNRKLQELRRAGLVSVRGKSVVIHDFAALRAVAMFDEQYLDLNPASEAIQFRATATS